MSNLQGFRCDYCGKETRDIWLERGWVHSKMMHLTISAGERNTNGMGEVVIGIKNEDSTMDWCCLSHFILWLIKQKSTKQLSQVAQSIIHEIECMVNKEK